MFLTALKNSRALLSYDTFSDFATQVFSLELMNMDSLFTQTISDELEDIPQTHEPVWILGRKYNAIKELEAIRRDIRSKLWFTYRKGFVPIGGCTSSFTSDKGWGCMLRCGQMVLGQALITLHLGVGIVFFEFLPKNTTNNSQVYRDQLDKLNDALNEKSPELKKKKKKRNYFPNNPIYCFGVDADLINFKIGKDWQWTAETKDSTYLKILSRFEEKRAAPFSIHQIALMGASEGKEVGQWFGPNTIAQVLKKLVVYDDWSSITIHVALDNTLIINDILRQCRVEGGTTAEVDGEVPLKAPSQWKPLLLLIPLRLGLSEINPVYINGLKSSFKLPQSLGMIGGKPNLALYFIGCVGDEVIYLDPHTTQRSGTVDQKLDENEIDMDATYHCKSASRIPITGMDPSVALCFFCATEREFISLCKSMQDQLISPEKQPLFELCSERAADWSPAEDAMSEAVAATSLIDFEHIERQYDTSDEEFELLG